MIETQTSPESSRGVISPYRDYPFPWAAGVRLAWSALWGERRTFTRDARQCISLLDPPLQVLNPENIPSQGPCLITVNHYSRAGFQSLWIPIAINACLPFEVHWVMTDSWRFVGRPFAHLLESLSRWAFQRIAQTYEFTSMPSMPPREHETQARSQAVRRVLLYARRHDHPVIGLAPEGYDMPGNVLGRPPAGAGRFIAHLAPHIQSILPVAVFEADGYLCVRFGERYALDVPGGERPDFIDRFTSDAVMRAIALLLPPYLRGVYS